MYNYCTRSAQTTTYGYRDTLNQGKTGANLVGGELYEKLKKYYQQHLGQLLAGCAELNEDALLQYYSEQWEKFILGGTLVHHIFRYLNRHWIKREMDEGHRQIYDVYTLSLVVWKETFFTNVESKAVCAAFKLIEMHRNGLTIQGSLIKSLTDSFGMFF